MLLILVWSLLPNSIILLKTTSNTSKYFWTISLLIHSEWASKILFIYLKASNSKLENYKVEHWIVTLVQKGLQQIEHLFADSNRGAGQKRKDSFDDVDSHRIFVDKVLQQNVVPDENDFGTLNLVELNWTDYFQ